MADAPVEVQVLGLAELGHDLPLLATKIGHDAGPAMERTAARTADVLRSRVPRLSGALAGSVVSGSEQDRSYLGMGEGLEYAGWIEYGGTRGRAYAADGRYVYPTARASESSLVVTAGDAAKKTIGGFPWRTPKT